MLPLAVPSIALELGVESQAPGADVFHLLDFGGLSRPLLELGAVPPRHSSPVIEVVSMPDSPGPSDSVYFRAPLWLSMLLRESCVPGDRVGPVHRFVTVTRTPTRPCVVGAALNWSVVEDKYLESSTEFQELLGQRLSVCHVTMTAQQMSDGRQQFSELVHYYLHFLAPRRLGIQ